MQTSAKNSGKISQWAIVALALILIIFGSYFFAKKSSTVVMESTTPSTEESLEQNSNAVVVTQMPPIKVVALKGVLSPSTFEMSVLEPVILLVEARDRDYTFAIKDSGIKYLIKKGSATEFSVGSLGVGNHTYTCGSGCSGVIRVTNESD